MIEQLKNSTETEGHFHEEKDYSSFSFEELLNELKNFKTLSVKEIIGDLNSLNKSFEEKLHEATESALHDFLEDGGNKLDFEFRMLPEHRDFQELHQKLRKSVSDYYQEMDDVRRKNLHRKQLLLDELRTISDSASPNDHFKRVKEIQTEWKESNDLPQNAPHDLWSNYKALLDIYYNNRNLLFDLVNLDRKKNLERKVELCLEVENLLNTDNFNKVTDELNHLHAEYKSIGPVPEKDADAIWERFKVASDKVHDKRREYFETYKDKLNENVVVKKAIIEKLKSYEVLATDSIDQWKVWGDEIEKIQTEWKKVGQVPNEVVKELNKEFWDLAKLFFDNKRKFFKSLDQIRKDNFAKKTELCDKVEELLATNDIDYAIKTAIRYQKEWKKIGPVPKAVNDKVYDRFRVACDAIFNKKRQKKEHEEKKFENNFELKQAVVAKFDTLKGDVESFRTLIKEWTAIGFVPKDKIKESKDSFQAVCDAFLASLTLPEHEIDILKLEVEVGAVKDNPNAQKVLSNKRFKIAEKLKRLKGEVNTIKTNIEFFASSKASQKLVDQMQGTIEGLESQILDLENQLNIINSIK